MATAYRTPEKKRRTFTAKPQPNLELDRLRDDVEKRYENTLGVLAAESFWLAADIPDPHLYRHNIAARPFQTVWA